jgi:hypothetical protein
MTLRPIRLTEANAVLAIKKRRNKHRRIRCSPMERARCVADPSVAAAFIAWQGIGRSLHRDDRCAPRFVEQGKW